MFGFKKKVEIIDINEAYEEYLKNEENIIIINVDELVHYDERHIDGAENLPYRLINDVEEYYSDKTKKYYIYSLNKGKSGNAAKVMAKKGYNVYELSDYTYFKGYEDGLSVKKKKRNKRRK
jgi:rhodanese-related sulfurtransferase